jgi:putative ABC transport system permease protein
MTARPPLKFACRWLLLAMLFHILALALLLGHGVEYAAARGGERLGADLMIVPSAAGISSGSALLGGVPTGAFLPDGIEGTVAALPGVKTVAPQYNILSKADSCCDVGDALLVGFDPSRDFTVLPWLDPGIRINWRKDEALAGFRVMKGAGAAIRLYNRVFTLVSRLDKSGKESFDTALFIPMAGLKAMERSFGKGENRLTIPLGRPSLLLVRLASAEDPDKVARMLESRQPGIRALTIPQQLRNERIRLGKFLLIRTPLATAAWTFVLFAACLLQVLFCRERFTILGLLQAFGCGKGRLLLLSGIANVIISLAAMTFGGAGTLLVLSFSAPFLGQAMGLPVLPVGVSVATTDLAWICPVFAAMMAGLALVVHLVTLRREPADLMRGD